MLLPTEINVLFYELVGPWKTFPVKLEGRFAKGQQKPILDILLEFTAAVVSLK